MKSIQVFQEVAQCSTEHIQYLVIARFLTKFEECLTKQLPYDLRFEAYINFTKNNGERMNQLQSDADVMTDPQRKAWIQCKEDLRCRKVP